MSGANMHIDYRDCNKLRLEFGGLHCELEFDKGLTTSAFARDSEKHSHFAHEMQVVTSGAGILHIEHTEIPLSAGSCILIGKNVYHSIFGLTPDFRRQDFRFHFCKQNERAKVKSRADAEDGIPDIFTPGFVYETLHDTRRIFLLLTEITRELEEKQLLYLSSVKSQFILLLTEVFREFLSSNQSEHASTQNIKEKERNYLIESFFDNYQRNLAAGELADLLSISKRQLTRIMQDNYQTTFKQKLLDTRIAVAKDLLKDKSLSIKTVSEYVGYASEKNFHSIFKKKTGMTPTVFRQAISENLMEKL